MSQAQELIQEIEKVGGSVQLKDGDRLRIEAPRGSLTGEIKDALAQKKMEIITLLKDTQVFQNCQGCKYHDTGPTTPDGRGTVHWRGPWEEVGGDTRWLNIAELTACPLGKWGSLSETVH